MSFLGKVFDFEKFHGKDILKKIGHQPWRLVTGVDPASTKIWNKVLGTKGEPIVDQMGGAYGGHMFSAFGNKDGGVYGRAKAAGIDTGPGGNLQDAAHVISALYAGNYGLDKLGLSGQGTTGEGWQQMPTSGQPMGQESMVDEEKKKREEEEALRRRKAIAMSLRSTNNQSFDPVGYA